jgi:hypothetical protein
MSTREELLSRYHDGELDPEAAETLRAELSVVEQQKLSALQELDGLISNTLTAEANGRKLDLWAALESQLPETPKGELESRPAATQILPFLRRRSVRVTAVLSSLAAAAALMLLLRPHEAQSNRCDIEELDVAGQSATVIAVPDEHGQETALIWFDHQETDEWESL